MKEKFSQSNSANINVTASIDSLVRIFKNEMENIAKYPRLAKEKYFTILRAK